MTPAFLLSIGGIVAGTRRSPWRKLAVSVGVVGLLLGIAGLGIGLFACWEERNHVNSRGEHFLPSPFFCGAGMVTLGAAICSTWLGIFSRRQQPGA